ncbi:hypothetical protein NDU88_005106 [Pleurodeles waltl]|uniref:Snake toxin/toxin-like domain-containing protein n=1 Tax=Pleurodeles waltl TaxID=8319 RepID=A0AAV7V3M7_PLEWA|nr:hypothetical protein NDU88_005106 [Pleurodeles waltl]
MTLLVTSFKFNGPSAPACNTITNCSSDLDSYCVKVEDHEYFYSGFRRSASLTATSSVENEPAGKGYESQTKNTYRGCSALCRGGEGENGYYYSFVSCCSTDLCNGANTVRTSALLLPLAAALLLRARL